MKPLVRIAAVVSLVLSVVLFYVVYAIFLFATVYSSDANAGPFVEKLYYPSERTYTERATALADAAIAGIARSGVVLTIDEVSQIKAAAVVGTMAGVKGCYESADRYVAHDMRPEWQRDVNEMEARLKVARNGEIIGQTVYTSKYSRFVSTRMVYDPYAVKNLKNNIAAAKEAMKPADYVASNGIVVVRGIPKGQVEQVVASLAQCFASNDDRIQYQLALVSQRVEQRLAQEKEDKENENMMIEICKPANLNEQIQYMLGRRLDGCKNVGKKKDAK